MLSFKKIEMNFDLNAWRTQLQSQFQNLNPRDPSTWPALPRYSVFLASMIGVMFFLWFFWLSTVTVELNFEYETEIKLRDDYIKKLAQAINLDVLKKQREQVQQYVTQIERQLPSKAEMDALLSDINQAGLSKSLQFELFRPGQVSVKEYYAELPIALRVVGRYHDIGGFTADVASLSRIVNLGNLTITPRQDGTLAMEATAKTFRYLDQEEIQIQKKATSGAKK